jgi:hypothetical protein
MARFTLPRISGAMTRSPLRALPALLAALPLLAAADEGMWTFDNFPAAAVRQSLGVDITPQWLDRVRRSTVRLAGCTASFISPEGLALTNHHCVAACIAELSSAAHDRLRDGFLARTRAEELRCSKQTADVLMEIEDVTAKVAAATAGKDPKAAGEERRKALTRLEQACEQAAGTTDPRRCSAVKLYQGGQYFLYKYRRYDDVRLVFAPEAGIAQFGGDPDNFQFPRWNLDMSLLRVYEGGRPLETRDFLPIRWSGPDEREPVFVVGHPGETRRLLTVAQLEARRKELPLSLMYSSELRGRYLEYARGGEEQARTVVEPLYNIENGIKVLRRQLDALNDGPLIAQKTRDEAALRERARLEGASDPWVQTAAAEQRKAELWLPYRFLEQGLGFGGSFSELFTHARTLVRGAEERPKPNAERLREYRDNALPEVEQRLFAAVPVYPGREEVAITLGMLRMREYLGPDHPVVARLFRDTSPEALAAQVASKTQLADPAERRRLWEGGAAAVAASEDPMIRLVAAVDAEARAVRKRYEDEVEAPTDTAAERIAAARFAAYGTSVYPDATFTLRVNPGTVQGWVENGEPVPPFTRLDRAYQRATGAEPFALPARWLEARGRLDPQTPFNLTSNNDVVGGNSGSPLVDAQGRVVGLVFDGNIHSISGAYWFDAARNRTISVHPAIIKLALGEVYGATELARELGLK